MAAVLEAAVHHLQPAVMEAAARVPAVVGLVLEEGTLMETAPADPIQHGLDILVV